MVLPKPSRPSFYSVAALAPDNIFYKMGTFQDQEGLPKTMSLAAVVVRALRTNLFVISQAFISNRNGPFPVEAAEALWCVAKTTFNHSAVVRCSRATTSCRQSLAC